MWNLETVCSSEMNDAIFHFSPKLGAFAPRKSTTVFDVVMTSTQDELNSSYPGFLLSRKAQATIFQYKNVLWMKILLYTENCNCIVLNSKTRIVINQLAKRLITSAHAVSRSFFFHRFETTFHRLLVEHAISQANPSYDYSTPVAIMHLVLMCNYAVFHWELYT